VSQSEVEQLVSGLRQHGYTFTDLRRLGLRSTTITFLIGDTLLTWLEINLGAKQLASDGLAQQLACYGSEQS
jgi:hypothetical protein